MRYIFAVVFMFISACGVAMSDDAMLDADPAAESDAGVQPDAPPIVETDAMPGMEDADPPSDAPFVDSTAFAGDYDVDITGGCGTFSTTFRLRDFDAYGYGIVQWDISVPNNGFGVIVTSPTTLHFERHYYTGDMWDEAWEGTFDAEAGVIMGTIVKVESSMVLCTRDVTATKR